MDGTVTLHTPRLMLRKETLEDAQLLHVGLGCDPDITRYTGWNPYATPEAAREKVVEDIRGYQASGCYAWIIQWGEAVVGTIGAYDYDPETSAIEIGYSIFKPYWGRGFASEAVGEVVRYLFEKERMQRIHAWCHGDHGASARVLEKAGLKLEGLRKQAMRNPDGSPADQKLYGVSAEQWSL